MRSLPAWLTAPGVCHGYSFVPTGKEYTDGKYNTGGDIPQNILDYLQVIRCPEPAKPEGRNGLSWPCQLSRLALQRCPVLTIP